MAHVRITEFAGIMPELSARLKSVVNAQIAHNCLLTDGSLRPQAEWFTTRQWGEYQYAIGSIVYNPDTKLIEVFNQLDAVLLTGEPFSKGIAIGADEYWYNNFGIVPYISYSKLGLDPQYTWDAGVHPEVQASVSYTRSYDSIKPVNRIYAISRVRIRHGKAEESILYPIPDQLTTDILYEGDLVEIDINASTVARDEATHIRLYRSISGLDTGENVTNELDTSWHLVAQMDATLSNLKYIDGESATALPLDVNYSQNFHAPQIQPLYFGLSESGWFVAAGVNGDIQISERYMHHAWPVDNYMRLQGEAITDLVVNVDTVYVGTKGAPYAVALAAGENGLQASARPFTEHLPCLPGTMTAAPGGALYASGQGVVALSREGMQVISRDVANAGDVLYRKTYLEWDTEGGTYVEAPLQVSIDRTTFGAYYQGNYYGFTIPRYPRNPGFG